MSQTMRSLAGAALSAALALAAIPAARATVIFNNLGSSQDGSDAVFGTGPLAQSFTTGSSGEWLRAIDLLLINGSAAFTGSVQVTLLADASHAPGALVATIGGIADTAISTAGPQIYTVSPTSTPVVLAANTTYWVELTQTTPNAVEWLYSLDTTASGVAGQYAYSAATGSNAVSGYGAYMMNVEVPEPAALALVATGLLGLAVVRRRYG